MNGMIFSRKKDFRAELDEPPAAFPRKVLLSFEAVDHRQVVVKAVDDRVIELLKIVMLEDAV